MITKRIYNHQLYYITFHTSLYSFYIVKNDTPIDTIESPVLHFGNIEYIYLWGKGGILVHPLTKLYHAWVV